MSFLITQFSKRVLVGKINTHLETCFGTFLVKFHPALQIQIFEKSRKNRKFTKKNYIVKKNVTNKVISPLSSPKCPYIVKH